MNVKKLISSVSAIAIAASAFAGLAVTASAYTVSLSEDVTVAGYKNGTFYNFQTNDPAVLPTSGDLRYREGGTFGLHNFGAGNRTGATTISVKTDDLLLIETYNTNGQPVTATINCGTANAAASTSTGYTAFDITSDGEVSFTVNRYSGIMGALVLEKDTSAATADYTIAYVDVNGNMIKDYTIGNGVVGTTVPVDTSDIVVDGQKYNYVSNDSAENAIEPDGSAIVTIIYKKAATYSYTVKADQGDITIASGSAFEGDTVKVAYPKYINVDGTLYERGVTNKEYNHTFTLDENNKVVTLAYAPTEISNVVFLAEGEDIDGLTTSNATNTKIRSSKSGSAFAAEDTTITTLPAGKYQVYGVLFSASSGGANLEFTLGDNNFAFVSTSNSNWVDVNSDELEITEETDLVLAAGGGNNAALDYIYIVKTGEVAPPAPTTYTIALDYADGTEPVTTEKEENDTFIFPTPEEPEGFAFLGWKLNKLGGDDVIVQGGDSITVTADASYTAVWIKYPTLDEDMIGIFTQYDGNPAVAYKGTATAGTYAIDSLKWYVMEDVNQIGSVDIDVNIAADTSVVVGLVVEAATVEADNIWAYLGIGGYAELD